MPEEGRKKPAKESSFERQRRRPMWGCVRGMLILSAIGLVILMIALSGGLYYIRTPSFANYIRKKIEQNLEFHLGREVTIAKVTVIRSSGRVILDDLRIANAPGTLQPYFATARQVEITGGIESFWQRKINVGRVDVRDPALFFEVMPAGSTITHNFPRWKRTPPRRFKYQITRLDIQKMYVTGGRFDFFDRRHDIYANLQQVSSEITPIFRQGIYAGEAFSPKLSVRIKDYEPFDLNLRGGFHYKPGSLELKTIALRGEGIETFVSGKLEPLTDGAYDLHLLAKTELDRIREIFRVQKTLDGELALDTNLRGKQGDFTLAGGFTIPELTADVYELADVKGKLEVTDEKMNAVITSARYGGGTVTADYDLSKYAEPYPMTIDLHYERVAIEKLFADWTLKNIGLRGGATGDLQYAWNKDDLLSGSGEGDATLDRGAVAFGNARYPTPVAGKTSFALNRGVISFRPSRLDTGKSNIDFSGTLRIEDLDSKLAVKIRSDDFAELDRIAYNFAHAADKRDYELLGLGGSGTVEGTVQGRMKAPNVVASINGSSTRYNNVLLGDSTIRLRYDGPKETLTFEDAEFRDSDGILGLTGTLKFPARGASPIFDLRVTARNYPVERALEAVELEDLGLTGSGTGALTVTGTPKNGTVVFQSLDVREADSRIGLNGSIDWAPGKGNLTFDLDLGAESVPVEKIAKFLDLGSLPVSGLVTGTLHLEGPKKALEGAGAVRLAEGKIMGEPVQSATADLLFTSGVMKATNVQVQAASGTILADAEYDFARERFSYIVRSADIDLARVQVLGGLSKLFSGRLRMTSTGAGTADDPEIVVDAVIEGGTFRGAPIPAGQEPRFYLAMRNGQLIIKASAIGAMSLEASGTFAKSGTIDATGQLRIEDVTAFMALVSPTTEFPATGNLVVDFRLGGKLTPLEALTAEATIPTLVLRVSDHELTAASPPRLTLRDGRLFIESFDLRADESTLALAGSMGLVGKKEIDVTVRGLMEAALIQLFTPDVKAEGHIYVAAGVTGTLDDPRVNGTAEIREAEFRLAGFPQLIDDVTGTLVFRGDRVELDALRATVGGGSVIAGGFMTLKNFAPERVRVNLQGSDVAIRYFEGVTVEGDFVMLLSGDAERSVLQGEVQVERALYYKDFDFATSILDLLLERRGLLPEVAASWQDRVALRIHLNAPETLAVENNVAKVTGSADLDLTGTLSNPIILGRVSIDEGGKVRFQEVDYRVVRGTVNFQNPFRIDPFFDVTAEGRVQEYELTINITGTLDRITPTITSDPPIGDLTLLSLLGPGGLGAGQTAQLGAESFRSAGTSFLFTSVGGLIGSKILPFVDSFSVDSGTLEGSSEAKPRVTFEKRISSDLRVIVIYNTTNNENKEIVEWQVTPDWVIQFTRDTEIGTAYLINAIDARFRRRYEGHW